MPALRSAFPDYPEMFERLLRPHAPDAVLESIAVVDGALLPDPARLDAVLITGSPVGVYDDEPWMAPLMDFIRWTASENVPQVGICFGHQAMAQALGGRVVKSEKGWGLGRHTYEVTSTTPWMQDNAPKTFALAVSHQDQVISPPPGAKTIATSEFCAHAGLQYTQTPAISFQGHPEFSDSFAAALYENRRGAPLSDDQVDTATASLSRPDDNDLLGQWITSFYASSTTTR
ncbi:MAG: type 1 glutamine amidotransferase [Pseudomonadota bacterium]